MNLNNYFFFTALSSIFLFAIYARYEQVKRDNIIEYVCEQSKIVLEKSKKKHLKVTEIVSFIPEEKPEQITSGVTKTKVKKVIEERVTLTKDDCEEVTADDLASVVSLTIEGENPNIEEDREGEIHIPELTEKNFVPDENVLKVLQKLNHENLKYLRLSRCFVSENTLKYISKFFNLKELDIFGCKLEKVPDEIGALQELTILNIGHVSLDKISKSVFNLKKLRQLSLTIEDMSGNKIPSDILFKKKSLKPDNPEIKYVPSEIGELQNLETLTIWTEGIKLGALPKEIGDLKELKVLTIFGDADLESLPNEIGQLENLKILSLKMQTMNDFPVSFGHLKKLELLNLYASEFEKFPVQLYDLENLSYLCVNCKNLRELPHDIGKLKNLEYFYVINGQLKTLPPEISQLKKLKRLKIANNQLTEIPKEIIGLKKLDVLDLPGNQLSELPKEINEMHWLAQLDISNNRFKKFPNIFGLKNLFILTISGNQLTEIPEEINQLKRLGIFDACDNQIESLPDSFYDLKWDKIFLSGNKIQKLSNKIKNLKGDWTLYLNLSKNQLKELPPEISQIEELSQLNVSRNQLTDLPSELPKKLYYLNISYNNFIYRPKVLEKYSNIRIKEDGNFYKSTSTNSNASDFDKILVEQMQTSRKYKQQLQNVWPEV